jgi:hypothetical protein
MEIENSFVALIHHDVRSRKRRKLMTTIGRHFKEPFRFWTLVSRTSRDDTIRWDGKGVQLQYQRIAISLLVSVPSTSIHIERRPGMMPSIRIWTSLLLFLISALLAPKLSFSSSTLRDDNNIDRQRYDDHRGDNEDNRQGHRTTTATSEDHVIECGIYLAPSSIPGSGLGMYVGNRTFDVDDIVTDEDIVIPIFEREWHSNIKGKFLWDEYIWNGDVSFLLNFLA